jgi:hypothetical protein
MLFLRRRSARVRLRRTRPGFLSPPLCDTKDGSAERKFVAEGPMRGGGVAKALR